ncbi:MAG: ferritin family protein [Phycisphaerae bacterium]|jgi:rubrerythrin
MGILFSADEVLAVAQIIEINGVHFYEHAATLAPAGEPRDLLNELARWEQTHERTFADMRRLLSQGEKDSGVFDPNDETALYLQALADTKVFDPKADVAARLGAKPDFRDILTLAIGMEKESIVFYVGMKDMVPASLGQSRVDAILKEEMSHLTMLHRQLQRLR